MQIVRFWNPATNAAVLAAVQGDDAVDLSHAFSSFAVLIEQARRDGKPPAAVAQAAVKTASRRVPLATLLDAQPHPAVPHLLQPVDAEEYWGAGVTYERSRLARMAESQSADVYARIYQAERPEIFFKATPSRCVGPSQAVGIRADSRWSVPEPELALVLDGDGRILGYTLGNDMSARDIEGDNPLYLPQAKVYQACCSIGPTVLLADGTQHPQFEIACRILRNGQEVFSASTSTARMRRGFDELATYLRRHNPLPRLAVLLTGTGIVPPDDFSLADGDVVEITSPALGTLRNPVMTVEAARATQG